MLWVLSRIASAKYPTEECLVSTQNKCFWWGNSKKYFSIYPYLLSQNYAKRTENGKWNDSFRIQYILKGYYITTLSWYFDPTSTGKKRPSKQHARWQSSRQEEYTDKYFFLISPWKKKSYGPSYEVPQWDVCYEYLTFLQNLSIHQNLFIALSLGTKANNIAKTTNDKHYKASSENPAQTKWYEGVHCCLNMLLNFAVPWLSVCWFPSKYQYKVVNRNNLNSYIWIYMIPLPTESAVKPIQIINTTLAIIIHSFYMQSYLHIYVQKFSWYSWL